MALTRLVFIVISTLTTLSGCYAHWGNRFEADAAQWMQFADEACARGDRRAVQTYLHRAWEIDGRGEDRLDGEPCPANKP